MSKKHPDPNCEFCLGTGEVDVPSWNSDAGVYENTGTAPCQCTKTDDESDGGTDFGGGSKPVRPIEPLPTGSEGGGACALTPSPIALADLLETV